MFAIYITYHFIVSLPKSLIISLQTPGSSNQMAISSQTSIVLTLHDSSNSLESPKQSAILKPLLDNRVSRFLQNHTFKTPNFNMNQRIDSLKCAQSDNVGKTAIVTDAFHIKPDRDGRGGGENGKFPPGSGGGGGYGGGEEDDDHDEKEFGPVLKFEEVMKATEARGVKLPLDMLEAAKATGLRKLILMRYLDLQGSDWGLGFMMKYCAMLRNRMLVDPSFMFKVGTEIVIDICCATFAEVQKRGKEFWAEFELYAADLVVGLAVDMALVCLLAPYARIRKRSVASGGLFSGVKNSIAALPSSVFEAERPGCRFSAQQRIAAFFYKGLLYGSVGFGCGLVGQGVANMIMRAKRSMNESEDDIPVPPLLKSAALWGVFLAVSANTRYQTMNGLESLVEGSRLAKRVPQVAMTFTVGVRFANNVYGGMQFVDWARLSGVQ